MDRLVEALWNWGCFIYTVRRGNYRSTRIASLFPETFFRLSRAQHYHLTASLQPRLSSPQLADQYNSVPLHPNTQPQTPQHAADVPQIAHQRYTIYHQHLQLTGSWRVLQQIFIISTTEEINCWDAFKSIDPVIRCCLHSSQFIRSQVVLYICHNSNF